MRSGCTRPICDLIYDRLFSPSCVLACVDCFRKGVVPLNERTLYAWVRDLHLILGLFASPFLLVFAASTLLLNHGWIAEVRAAGGGEGEEVGRHVVIPADASRVDQAKAIMGQVGILGEVRNIFRRKGRLEIPVMKPGLNLTVWI